MPTLIADPRLLAESTGTREGRADGSRSSGIASRIKASFPASARAIAGNYAAAASLILLGYAFYATVPCTTEGTRVYYDGLIPPASWAALRVVVIAYLVLLPLYYATFPDDHTVKCRRFWQGLFALPHRWPTPEEAVAFRAVAVKAIFGPLMVSWFLMQAHDLTTSTEAFLSFGRFFPYGYYAIYHGLFVVDVFLFAVGYWVEHPRLGNEIRSVEPTLLGWLAALMCYPPLTLLTANTLGWYSFELPGFRSPALQLAAAVATLLGVGVYAWASVALGLRASNLTNRGIVTTGPYRWMRHPAYVAKNFAWWIGATPLFLKFACTDPWHLVSAILGTAAWSGIYVLRRSPKSDISGAIPTTRPTALGFVGASSRGWSEQPARLAWCDEPWRRLLSPTPHFATMGPMNVIVDRLQQPAPGLSRCLRQRLDRDAQPGPAGVRGRGLRSPLPREPDHPADPPELVDRPLRFRRPRSGLDPAPARRAHPARYPLEPGRPDGPDLRRPAASRGRAGLRPRASTR